MAHHHVTKYNGIIRQKKLCEKNFQTQYLTKYSIYCADFFSLCKIHISRENNH